MWNIICQCIQLFQWHFLRKLNIFIDCIGITTNYLNPYIIMPFSKLATAKLAVNLNRFCLKVWKVFYKAKQILQTDNYCLCMLLKSGGELLELRLLDMQLLDTFGSKSIARHKIDKLFESSKSWLNLIRTDDENILNCSNPVFI